MAQFLFFTFPELPVQKLFEIGDSSFTYRLEHNETFDFFTLTLLDENDVILYTNKLVYRNNYLISGAHLLPEIDREIIPTDIKNLIKVLNQESLDNPVKIYLN